jgi:hypothetical protein
MVGMKKIIAGTRDQMNTLKSDGVLVMTPIPGLDPSSVVGFASDIDACEASALSVVENGTRVWYVSVVS